MATTKKDQPDKNTPRKCAHPGCNCPARPGEQYCSDFCENIVGSDVCGCGHTDCKPHTHAEARP
ncbi:hypothetical protein [Methylobacter sp. YRD-M1]|uniref:hypothetical protein n=1 Tax=Methylobacter sp. YRD-M1 TaxID=2911520 RepID=UPI00227D1180|nr:hypothetical protein [Methylobacter sp. YRD-M1]WAK02646.1 hypothetical protein LZ558_02315 [Methylobacter sp. YRD-M1]